MQPEKKDLRQRTKEFALQIIRLFSELPKTTEAQVLGKQVPLAQFALLGSARVSRAGERVLAIANFSLPDRCVPTSSFLFFTSEPSAIGRACNRPRRRASNHY